MLHHIVKIDAFQQAVAIGWPVGPHDCDGCGDRGELYHSDATGGLALCDACDQLAEQDANLFSKDADVREAARQRYVVEWWMLPRHWTARDPLPYSLHLPHDWSVKA